MVLVMVVVVPLLAASSLVLISIATDDDDAAADDDGDVLMGSMIGLLRVDRWHDDDDDDDDDAGDGVFCNGTVVDGGDDADCLVVRTGLLPVSSIINTTT